MLRTNIAVDKKLPFGFTGTFEFIYTKSINEIIYRNLNVEPTGEVNAFDGRLLFGTPSTSGTAPRGLPDYVHPEYESVLKLENTSKGYYYSASFQLQKEWRDGSMINASYTFGRAKDMLVATTARAIEGWDMVVRNNPNDPELSYSAHDPGHRILVAVSKRFNFFKNAPTIFSIAYNGRSGKRYSTRYSNDINGDGLTNDSIWVPANADDIILTHGTWEDLNKYIQDDPALAKHRGEILPCNASRGNVF